MPLVRARSAAALASVGFAFAQVSKSLFASPVCAAGLGLGVAVGVEVGVGVGVGVGLGSGLSGLVVGSSTLMV